MSNAAIALDLNDLAVESFQVIPTDSPNTGGHGLTELNKAFHCTECACNCHCNCSCNCHCNCACSCGVAPDSTDKA
ncbi:hypothetical protein [Streptomyces sp. CT34]|uniref:hypothetical protein n=1 Tax=Streptomyces sp. CT34 TaxID=1553907 RepID=UPI000A41DBCD|nr:hypothetical protein [Streptomyces sp. CT34]